MRWLKILLAINGVVFLRRSFINISRPTSFYLHSDAPKNAVDAVRVIGITFVGLGLIQLSMWWVADRLAVRIVAGASHLFAAGFAALTATAWIERSDVPASRRRVGTEGGTGYDRRRVALRLGRARSISDTTWSAYART